MAPRKAAVIGLTKAVAADFITQGIRCNAICPGTIESPVARRAHRRRRRRRAASRRRMRQAFIDRQPMGRLGTPRRSPARGLSGSDESSYTTGQIHLADGGFAL